MAEGLREAGMELVELGDCDLAAVCALNNLFAQETSFLTEPEMSQLLHMAFCSRGFAEQGGLLGAFLIALDERAEYANANFAFFRARRKRFVYIDRVITAAHAVRQGLARKLYEHLFLRAAAAQHTVVGCEVNLLPPNPASDAFHARMGFVEVGTAQLANGKTVRYLERTFDQG
jgi:predicted GNAT superfamily acetyltransferase